ncbi:replication initiation protein RepC [Paracoccus laeviglucosivorans]|uniref:Replication initiation protein RepC n=2 Tax=Paracoccus laeviglucosivorans TaxID=1197861 RepID=A0A521FN78_9RHOB|nr:replication initiation protein RepC [Paracoccus laeviglucosivorans]
MAAVNICSRDLGIRQGAVVVLDALLSCLPCRGADGREVPVSSTNLLTVYASNETLCFRAKGLTDRQLRRHLEKLETAGLIRRRDSANGKRFPIMQNGKPVGAFGLDLSPLFARSDDLRTLALRRREEADELRGLKSQILRLRAACTEIPLDEALCTFVDGLRNMVRRTTLTIVEARAALKQLTAVLTHHATKGAEAREDANDPRLETRAEAPSYSARATTGHNRVKAIQVSSGHDTNQIGDTMMADQTPASDGRNVRHIKPYSDSKKIGVAMSNRPDWGALTQINAFYDEPTSVKDTARIAFEFGKMLRIAQNVLASAASRLGLWDLLRLENRMAEQIAYIRDPNAYMKSVLRN